MEGSGGVWGSPGEASPGGSREGVAKGTPGSLFRLRRMIFQRKTPQTPYVLRLRAPGVAKKYRIGLRNRPPNMCILPRRSSKRRCFFNAPEKRGFPLIFSSRFVANRQQSHVLALPYYFWWFHGVSGHLQINPRISVYYRAGHQKRGVF